MYIWVVVIYDFIVEKSDWFGIVRKLFGFGLGGGDFAKIVI